MVLISIGTLDKDVLEVLRQPLEEVFGQRMRIGDSIELPRVMLLPFDNTFFEAIIPLSVTIIMSQFESLTASELEPNIATVVNMENTGCPR